MAATSTDIANLALAKLRTPRITALTDGSEMAIRVTDVYALVRDIVLRSHPWNFAIKRSALSKLASTPAFEFNNEFQLPSDCLRVLYMFDSDSEFRIEGRKLLTDDTTVDLVYVAQITAEGQFDPMFVEVFALRLAVELAYALDGKVTLVEHLMNQYTSAFRAAKAADGKEGTPKDIRYNFIEDARRTGKRRF